MGFGYLFLSTFAVNKLGVTPANLTAIVGQIVAGFIIDATGLFGSELIEFSWQRAVSLVLMLAALALIFSEKMMKLKRHSYKGNELKKDKLLYSSMIRHL